MHLVNTNDKSYFCSMIQNVRFSSSATNSDRWFGSVWKKPAESVQRVVQDPQVNSWKLRLENFGKEGGRLTVWRQRWSLPASTLVAASASMPFH